MTLERLGGLHGERVVIVDASRAEVARAGGAVGVALGDQEALGGGHALASFWQVFYYVRARLTALLWR